MTDSTSTPFTLQFKADCDKLTADTIRVSAATILHDKLIRSYLFTLNRDGPTESDLSAGEVDLILAALKRFAAPSPS